MLSSGLSHVQMSRKLTMKHTRSALLLAVALTGSVGCPETPTPPGGDYSPQVDKWEVVIKDLPFPVSGDAPISLITIGGKESSENFANRGDIEVLYDHDQETITVEIRRYVFGDELDANGDGTQGGVFERLSLWAYATSSLGKPSEQDPADDCSDTTWKDNCNIRVYYDGKAQPVRSGADLRVHLPKGYRGEVFVQTEDNTEEASYPKRGNVTIDGLCGGGQIGLQSGRANIKMCRDLTPAPTCPADSVVTCEGWPDGDGAEAWSKDCPCSPDLYGQLLIESPQPFAGNITVDIPAGVWLNTTVENKSKTKPNDCKPSIACTEPACKLDPVDDYRVSAEFNYPSPAAAAGAGFNLTINSGDCTKIPFLDNPADWSADGEPPEELRGLIKVCTDCI